MEEEFKVTNDILATSGQRLANLFLDRLFYYICMLGYGMILGVAALFLEDESIIDIEDNNAPTILLSWILYFLMYFILEATKQRTLGKYISKTMVVLENGEKPDIKTIALRTICRIIPFDAFSYLGSTTRGWHDSLSKTYVVDIEKFYNKIEAIEDFKDLGKSEEDIVSENDIVF